MRESMRRECCIRFFFYCKEKVERFSDLFESIHTSGDSTVREADNQISSFSILEEMSDAWPENALSIFTSIEFDLWAFQGKQNDDFELEIENEADADECYWKFDGDFTGERVGGTYKGQDLEVLKKTFNEMIRFMMNKLSEQSND